MLGLRNRPRQSSRVACSSLDLQIHDAPGYLLLSKLNSDNVCGRCTQVEELLCLLTDLWDAVNRLWSICKSDKGADWWNPAVLSGTKMLTRYNTWQGVSCTLSPGRRQWPGRQRSLKEIKTLLGPGREPPPCLLILSVCPYAADIRLCSWMDWDMMRLEMTYTFLRSHQGQVSWSPLWRNTFNVSRSIQAVVWAAEWHQPGDRTLRDTAEADNPHAITHLDCKGIKNRVSLVLGPSLEAHKTFELLCCYLAIVPRLNCLKDLWVWNSAVGNLQSNW